MRARTFVTAMVVSVASACASRHAPRGKPTAPVTATVARVARPANEMGAQTSPFHRLAGQLRHVRLFADGTLGVVTTTEIVTLDRAGVERHANVTAELASSGAEHFVLENADRLTIVDVAELRERWNGQGLVMDDGLVLATSPDPGVTFWRHGHLVRLSLPHSLAPKTEVVVSLDSEGNTALVQWFGQRGRPGCCGGALFDVTSQKLLKLTPVLVSPTFVGDTLYGLDGRRIVAIAAKAGALVRSGAIPPRYASRPDLHIEVANARHLLLRDLHGALLFDSQTLTFRHDLGTVAIGCFRDNHLVLNSPYFDRDNADELVTDLCDGELRMDLVAGIPRCCDLPDLATENRWPSLPRCAPPSAVHDDVVATYTDDRSPTWSPHAHGLTLEAGAVFAHVSSDESRLVYQYMRHGTDDPTTRDAAPNTLTRFVVLRALPGGEVLRHYAFED